MKKLIISTLIITSIYGTVIADPINIGVNPIVEVQAASIKLNTKSITLSKGQKYTLKVKNTKKQVKWSSSNKKIVTVSSKGKVTAKKTGTAYIYAKVAGKTLKCKITVKNKIKLNTTSKTLLKGKTVNLKVTGTSKKVKWSSSNKKIATVSSKGKVTAKKVGTAYIYAKVSGKRLKCKIKVQSHKHEWRGIMKTVHYEEKGHYETVVVKEPWTEYKKVYCYFCQKCNKNEMDFGMDREKFFDHLFDCCASYRVDCVIVDKIYHPAETKRQWVIDQREHDGEVATAFKCIICGAKQKSI